MAKCTESTKDFSLEKYSGMGRKECGNVLRGGGLNSFIPLKLQGVQRTELIKS